MGLRIKSDKNKQLNISRYKYVVNIDTDEVILPANHTDWHAMMEHIEDISTREKIGGWTFNSTYFLDDMTKKATEGIPEYLHMMQHVFRGKSYTTQPKSFINTDNALILGQHFHMRCLNDTGCQRDKVNVNIAHSQHYRRDCPTRLLPICQEKFRNKVVKDTRIWIHRDQIINNTQIAFKSIDFES